MRRHPTFSFVCGALAVLSSPVLAQQQFSGRWSVQAVTEEGACSRAYRYPILIQDGTVSHGGSAGPAVSGRVQANGAIQGSIQRDTTRADVVGRLSERSGSGTWRTSGAVSCSGHWNAKKQG
jgi:hypothetical protein